MRCANHHQNSLFVGGWVHLKLLTRAWLRPQLLLEPHKKLRDDLRDRLKTSVCLFESSRGGKRQERSLTEGYTIRKYDIGRGFGRRRSDCSKKLRRRRKCSTRPQIFQTQIYSVPQANDLAKGVFNTLTSNCNRLVCIFHP